MFLFSANNFAMQHKRKTISGNDVIEAMKEMDFDRFVEPLQQALEGKAYFLYVVGLYYPPHFDFRCSKQNSSGNQTLCNIVLLNNE